MEACLSVAGRGILKPMLRPGKRGLLPGAVSPTRYPPSAGSGDRLRIPSAMRGPDPRSSVTFWEPGRLFTVGQRVIETLEQAVR